MKASIIDLLVTSRVNYSKFIKLSTPLVLYLKSHTETHAYASAGKIMYGFSNDITSYIPKPK